MFVVNMPKLNRRSHRLRDLFLYILIAVAVAGLAILLGVHAAKTGQRPDRLASVFGFVLVTLVSAWASFSFFKGSLSVLRRSTLIVGWNGLCTS
jgi:membrane protease YdiL (CAAX protease family)